MNLVTGSFQTMLCLKKTYICVLFPPFQRSSSSITPSTTSSSSQVSTHTILKNPVRCREVSVPLAGCLLSLLQMGSREAWLTSSSQPDGAFMHCCTWLRGGLGSFFVPFPFRERSQNCAFSEFIGVSYLLFSLLYRAGLDQKQTIASMTTPLVIMHYTFKIFWAQFSIMCLEYLYISSLILTHNFFHFGAVLLLLFFFGKGWVFSVTSLGISFFFNDHIKQIRKYFSFVKASLCLIIFSLKHLYSLVSKKASHRLTYGYLCNKTFIYKR